MMIMGTGRLLCNSVLFVRDDGSLEFFGRGLNHARRFPFVNLSVTRDLMVETLRIDWFSFMLYPFVFGIVLGLARSVEIHHIMQFCSVNQGHSHRSVL